MSTVTGIQVSCVSNSEQRTVNLGVRKGWGLEWGEVMEALKDSYCCLI